MVLLDRDEDDVLAAVESGVLAWAWDIRAVGSERRELRIWRDSLLDVIGGQRSRERTPEEVFQAIFPPRAVRTTELQRLWSCSSTHISHLLADGSLPAAPRPRRSGPLSVTRVEPAALHEFLRVRRVT